MEKLILFNCQDQLTNVQLKGKEKKIKSTLCELQLMLVHTVIKQCLNPASQTGNKEEHNPRFTTCYASSPIISCRAAALWDLFIS